MKPNMSTMFLIHVSVATLVPIRKARGLPVEIRRKTKNRMTEYKFYHNIRSKRRYIMEYYVHWNFYCNICS
jgi:hypothetical protein